MSAPLAHPPSDSEVVINSESGDALSKISLPQDSHHPARWWQIEPDGRMLCTLCPRACKLREGQRGLCFVRKRENDQMVLTTYGRSSGFCVDPIEKKPLSHFYPGSSVMSFGTAGCNLACSFCQNWEISKSREMDTLADEAHPESIAMAAQQAGCKSVAYTYNDPVIFAEYALDIAAACKNKDIKSVAVTAGYICDDARAEFFGAMDAVNVDLKAFTEQFYKQHCKAELANVKETLKYLVNDTDTWVEITTLLIPDENDSNKELDELTAWIAHELKTDVPLHFSAFHPDHKMRDKPRTPHATLNRARQIALKNGLQHVYVGNVIDHGRGSTFCPCCSKKLIARHGWHITGYAITENGTCRYCGHAIAGRFETPKTVWGNKRKRYVFKNSRYKEVNANDHSDQENKQEISHN